MLLIKPLNFKLLYYYFIYLVNPFLEELKIKNIGATIFNIKNVAITINTLFILLKTFKVFFPALCKFEGNYGDFII